MFKVKYVNDLWNVIGGRPKCRKGHKPRLQLMGLYLYNNETIYIPKRASWIQKRLTFLHELGHWLLHKTTFGHLRFQYYWDILWAPNIETVRIYRYQYKRMKERLPFSINNKLQRW